MERAKIELIYDELKNYIISSSRIPPYVTIVGEEIKSGNKKTSAFTIASENDFDEFIKILNGFSLNINGYIQGSLNIAELKGDDKDSGFFYKKVDEFDLETLIQLTNSSLIDPDIKVVDFLKPSRFKHVFLVIELNLDEASSKKLVLFKGISQNYYTAKNKFTLSPYNENHSLKVKYLDNKKDIIFDDNFEIAAYLDDMNASFIFVQNRRKFEDLFGYHEKYEDAYSMLSSKLDFIEWGKTEPTLYIKRYCYSISNYERVEECIEFMLQDLRSKEDNEIKMAFTSKKIEYNVKTDGQVHIIPENPTQLKALLYIINDGVAKTCLLGRNVMGTKFEELL
ncbi:hypothetical protein [Methanococcoides alaskense]|uniref:DUF4868 domain-containing protein n=1 Tax=Methanococcoides alaskense TaxID=325778 RepID=A0AA90TXK1_9EURY|nr:hypothetical protein [Methanococcoides alaskense]MDA0525154.1 hypothetical protein [Methanococcoides alaskense]MDR6221925.1 hypothetical protein [Methanococcoides alaskense]